MAKLDLHPGETMIGSGQMSLYLMYGLTKKPYQGYIFVTNQRVCFKIRMIGKLEVDLPLDEVKGFTVGHVLFITKVTIYDRAGKTYPLTGFPAKKLQGWLKQVGIQEIT